jgi:hypothetical protein
MCRVIATGTDSTSLSRKNSNALSANTLYNVIITYNGSGDFSGTHINWYFNGANPGNGYGPDAGSLDTSTTSTTPWLIGMGSAGSAPLTGQLNDLRAYNRVLTSSEISQIYSAGAQ